MMEVVAAQENVVLVRARGKVDVRDSRRVASELGSALEGKSSVRLLLEFENFSGFTLPALVAEAKLLLKHRHRFGRIAVTGDGRRAKTVASTARRFTKGPVRHFSQSHEHEARSWITEGLIQTTRPLSAPGASRGDLVDEASEQSFPASDPPGYTPSRM